MKDYYRRGEVTLFKNHVPSIRKKIENKKYPVDIGKYGISGNTFRAFHGYGAPSKIYRAWAKKKTESILRAGKIITSQEDFDAWHKHLRNSIQRRWKKEKCLKLKFAHKYKMIDLYLKWLCTYEKCQPKLTKSIIKYGHCPIDKKSLEKINRCLWFALPIKSPSMGHIKNKHAYKYCQQIIAKFAKHCGGTSLIFDFYVWPPKKK